MTKKVPKTNSEPQTGSLARVSTRDAVGFRHSGFFRHSSFVIRHFLRVSIQHPRMHIRPVHRRMAPRAPASSLAKQQRVIAEANVNLPTTAVLHLRMASETQIGIALDQQLPVHRAVRVVTNRAAFPQRLMLEDEWPGLFAMAFRAILVEPRHRQAACGLYNVGTMGIMALHAIHAALQDRMMLWKVEFGEGLEMTLEAGGWFFSRVDDELAAAAASLEVFAPGSMA